VGLNVGVGAVDEAVDRNAVGTGVGAVDQRNTSRPFVVVACGCEPENANATPEIATAVTGGAVSGVAFVFSGGAKTKVQ
jgi:hypothetical protein